MKKNGLAVVKCSVFKTCNNKNNNNKNVYVVVKPRKGWRLWMIELYLKDGLRTVQKHIPTLL